MIKLCPFCNKEMKLVKSIQPFTDEKTNKTIKYKNISYICESCDIELCNKEMADKNLNNIKKALKDDSLSLYERLCVGCEREKWCHDNCEHCEEYEKALEVEEDV